MRLVILQDGTVGKDDLFYDNLDLSACGLPQNFWALQWNEHGDDTGHVEYNSPMSDNTAVTELPSWATACVAVWQAAKDAEDAAIAEAQAAAEAAAQASGGE